MHEASLLTPEARDPPAAGLGSLVRALNALGIDPRRRWKGSWRWFSEELLDCCKSLDEVRRSGITLDEAACLARCSGAAVAVHRARQTPVDAFRRHLLAAATSSLFARAISGDIALSHGRLTPEVGCGRTLPLMAGY